MGPEHQDVFTMMKKKITKAQVLAYYNPMKQTVLKTDASIKGLGACLLQEEQSVNFASRVLTEAQKGFIAIVAIQYRVNDGSFYIPVYT